VIDDARKMKKPCPYCGSRVRYDNVAEGTIYGLYVYRSKGESRFPVTYLSAKQMRKFCTRTCANLHCEEGCR